MKNKNICLLVCLLAFFVAAAPNASAQKTMQVTVVNNSADPVMKINVMKRQLSPMKYVAAKTFQLTEPIKTNGRASFSFEAAVLKPYVYEGRNIYMESYAVEIRWAGGCKKILDLNYELPNQIVSAGEKQCGLYDFELREMKDAKIEGDLAYAGKDYRTAASYYSNILEIDAKNEHALHRRGHSNSAIGEYAEAVADFTAALEVTAETAHLQYDRGNAYFALKDYPRAVVDLSRAVAQNPKNIDYLSRRWAAVCSVRNVEAAVADEKKLVEMGATLKLTCEEWLRQNPVR